MRLVILFLLSVLFGCDQKFESAERLSFWKHSETGLCFASISVIYANNFALTSVPCESVEHSKQYMKEIQ